MKTRNGTDSELKKTLDEFKSVPARNPETAALGRARFLAEAASLRSAQRQHTRPRAIVQSRRFAMNAVAAAIMILVLFFGGSVGAAFASQDALPGEALYSVKLTIENVRFRLISDPEAEIDLLMQFVQVRVIEMNELVMQGVVPPAEVQERLEQHIQTALELAAGMGDEQMQAVLLRLRTQLEEQNRFLADGAPEQIRALIRTQLQRIDAGITDPTAFRNTFRNEEQAGGTPAQTSGPQATPTPEATRTDTGSGAGGTPIPGGGQSPTDGPHNPQITPGPTPGSGGQSTPGGSGGDSGLQEGKP